mgnify:CR=1 FL=1
MRPVFNDFVSEIQRTIGLFGSVNRSARIRRIIGVGNGFRLAGLQRFLEQNLQQSWMWFSLAQAQGDEDAGKKREDIAARLDSKGLAVATVRGWAPTRTTCCSR